jgi:hypothetical protein
MVTTLAPKAESLVQEDTPSTNQDTSCIAEARDYHAPLFSVKGGALTEENEKMVSMSTTKMLLLRRQHLFMSETPPHLCRK